MRQNRSPNQLPYDERFPQAAELLADAGPDKLAFPVAHWRQVWSNNPQERLNCPLLPSTPATSTAWRHQ